VTLWYKPLSGLASWSSVALADGGDGRYSAAVAAPPHGGLQLAVEVAGAGFASRWPDPAEATPYLAIAPSN
jgi:hypothetical protein